MVRGKVPRFVNDGTCGSKLVCGSSGRLVYGGIKFVWGRNPEFVIGDTRLVIGRRAPLVTAGRNGFGFAGCCACASNKRPLASKVATGISAKFLLIVMSGLGDLPD